MEADNNVRIQITVTEQQKDLIDRFAPTLGIAEAGEALSANLVRSLDDVAGSGEASS